MGTGGRIKIELTMKISCTERESGRVGSSERDIADAAERAVAHLQKDQISEV